MDHDLIRARAIRIAAALMLASAGLVGITATPAVAHPEVCETGHEGDEHAHEEICFTQEEIDRMDDSAAELGVGEVAKSPNLLHLANLPKAPAFSAETSFNSDLAFTGHYAVDGNYNGFTILDIS